MKVIQLHAENFKRLGVVDITPGEGIVKIGGKNGHGKSSVLDAVYVALKGRAVAPPMPIREGQEKCTIRLDLGELIVTRNFHEKEGRTYTDTLKVEDSEGRRYGEPQRVLNELLGDIGFDPFEFMNLKPKDQAARLLELVPLSVDLDELAEADEADFAERRDINREIARLRANVESIPAEEMPGEVPDRGVLADQLGSAADHNASLNAEEAKREAERNRIKGGRASVEDNRARAKALRKEADELDSAADDMTKRIDAAEKALNSLPPVGEFLNTDEIRQKLRWAEEQHAVVERQTRRETLVAELNRAEAKAKALTDAMAERARQRNEALAEADMPVEGLAFALDDKGDPVLTFDGLPFDKDQTSTATQLRVSTAIGMAANPRLRVLRIKDGSLLDEDSMALLAGMAEAEDFQLWVEIVGKGEGVGIIMENGEIVGAEPAPADPAEVEAEPVTKKSKARAKKAAGDPTAAEGAGAMGLSFE